MKGTKHEKEVSGERTGSRRESRRVLTGILSFVTRPPLVSVLSSVAALSFFIAYSIHSFHNFCPARDSGGRAVWSGANTSRMG
jgi:hypothetical protein